MKGHPFVCPSWHHYAKTTIHGSKLFVGFLAVVTQTNLQRKNQKMFIVSLNDTFVSFGSSNRLAGEIVELEETLFSWHSICAFIFARRFAFGSNGSKSPMIGQLDRTKVSSRVIDR